MSWIIISLLYLLLFISFHGEESQKNLRRISEEPRKNLRRVSEESPSYTAPQA